MAHFEDLAEVRERYGTWQRLLAVGWLRKGKPFPTGAVPEQVVPRLSALREEGLWYPNGRRYPPTGRFHRCDLCDEPAYGRELFFVPSADAAFVAPELISHYIEAHHYAPPEDFIAAVLACPPMQSDEYAVAIAPFTPAARYNPAAVQVLEGIEAVRLRPGMYIGGTDARGLSHLVFEVLSNALDEHLAGHASHVELTVEEQSVTVEDDGRGMPIEATIGELSALEAIFARLHHGATLDGHVPHVHVQGGLAGVGLGAVNALSSRLEIEARRNGTRWTAAYERGVLVQPLTNGGPTELRGTRLRFFPDEEIFGPARLDPLALDARVEELSYFLPNVHLRMNGRLHRHPRGLLEWLPSLEPGLVEETQLAGSGRHENIDVDFALAWAPGREERRVTTWVNLGPTPEDGMHLSGFLAALEGSAPTKEAFIRMSRGLVAVVHTKLLAPEFGGPTKSHLRTKEAKVAVKAVVSEALRAAPWWWDRVLELSR